jgi:hypothetical protein
MNEPRVGETYLFEHRVYLGLYKHHVLSYEGETAEHGERYRIRAWQVEVTDRPGQYDVVEGPNVAWHDADAVRGYYASRWP